MLMLSLSLVVPVFNPGDALLRLLGSLEGVSEKVEVIFIDDGCTDGSRPRLMHFLESRRGTVLSGTNLGPGAARNLGIEAASSEFIAFADADDECRVDVLLDCVKLACESQADVVIAGYEIVKGKSSRKMIRPTAIHADKAANAGFRCVEERSAVWGKIYRRSFLIQNSIYFPEDRGSEDVVFSFSLAIASPITHTLGSISYVYFQNTQGQLTSNRTYYIDGVKALNALIQSEGLTFPERKLLGQVVLSSIPHFMRGLGVSMGANPSFQLLLRTRQNLGLAAMLLATISIGRNRFVRQINQ
jgi:glycosyltransferase involved in cell wall biosynthesis